MKTKTCLVALLVILAHSGALAGEIYGKVLLGGAAAGEGAVTIAVQCGSAEVAKAQTDKSGSYHLVASGTGKCTMTVEHAQQTATLTVASYDEAAQVDLELALVDGKLTVRRK